MSAKHPVIAVTGSSGAGTTTTSLAWVKIFAQLNLHAAEVEGDSFHRYTRPEMDMAIRKARDQGKHISYFGPEANDWPAGADLCRLWSPRQRSVAEILHTPMTKPCRGIRCRGPYRQPLPEPTDVLFMRGCTAGLVAAAA